MIDNLLRDLQVLRKADFLIARIWLNALVRRLGFLAFAALIAVFGLGMANVAGFYALQGALGAVLAAAIVAAVDLVIAVIVLLAGVNSRPGPEIDLAFEVRKMVWDSIQVDTKDLKHAVDNFGHNIQEMRGTVAGFVQNPLDTAAQKLLVPAVLSLLRGLRAKKEHA
jgi:hypothetical protein